MNKLILAFATLLLISYAEQSHAQTSVNKIAAIAAPEQSLDFIDGIAFTPDGILKSVETVGAARVNTTTSPAIVKSDNSSSSIENLSSLQFKYAMMMDVDVESLTNLSLLAFIEDWFGTRYRYGGETKRGIDCSALTGTLLLAVYGFAVPRTAREQYEYSEHIKKEELKEGDLVFFNTTGGVSHVGLYLENNYFVHASSSQGVTISNLDEPYFAKRYIGAGRIQE